MTVNLSIAVLSTVEVFLENPVDPLDYPQPVMILLFLRG
jgi:hypothetical protein